MDIVKLIALGDKLSPPQLYDVYLDRMKTASIVKIYDVTCLMCVIGEVHCSEDYSVVWQDIEVK